MDYKSSIDEFGTADCVICMEEFKRGVLVRKVPTCQHIFHDKCLLKWLASSQQQQHETAKCPMCNADVLKN
jgi:hypothetical protein